MFLGQRNSNEDSIYKGKAIQIWIGVAWIYSVKIVLDLFKYKTQFKRFCTTHIDLILDQRLAHMTTMKSILIKIYYNITVFRLHWNILGIAYWYFFIVHRYRQYIPTPFGQQ